MVKGFGPARAHIFHRGFKPNFFVKCNAADTPVGCHDYGMPKGRGKLPPFDHKASPRRGIFARAHRFPGKK